MNDVSERVEMLRERLIDHVEEGQPVKQDLADLFSTVAENVFEQQSDELASVKNDLAEHISMLARASEEPAKLSGDLQALSLTVGDIVGTLEEQTQRQLSEHGARKEELSRQERLLTSMGDGLRHDLATGLESTEHSTIEAFQEKLDSFGEDASGAAQNRFQDLTDRLERLSSNQSAQDQALRSELEQSLGRVLLEQLRAKEDLVGRINSRTGEIREEIRIRGQDGANNLEQAQNKLAQQMTGSTQDLQSALGKILDKADRIERSSTKTLQLVQGLALQFPKLQERVDSGLKNLDSRLAAGFSESLTTAEEQSSGSVKAVQGSINQLQSYFEDANRSSRHAARELERKILWGLRIVGGLAVLTTIVVRFAGNI